MNAMQTSNHISSQWFTQNQKLLNPPPSLKFHFDQQKVCLVMIFLRIKDNAFVFSVTFSFKNV